MLQGLPTHRLLLLCLLACAPAHAHLPELYGREYLRVDADSERLPGRQVARRQLQPPFLGEREMASLLRQREVSAGAYDQGLADPLTNQAHYQQERGDIEGAAASLRRAIQLIRINEGLNSERQLPLLKLLLALYREQGDFVALGNAYGYYYRVMTAGEGPVTPAQLPGVLDYLEGERRLYVSRADDRRHTHLLRAFEANHYLLEQAEDATPQVFVGLALSQMRNLYLILGDSPRDLVAGPGAGAVPLDENRLAGIQSTADGKGRRLLEDCLERLEGAPPRQLARIHLELGDWLHWNGHLLRAKRQYARVVELMAAAGEHAQLAAWFDEPVELPNMEALWPLSRGAGDATVLVEASYEVDRKGESRSVVVTAADESGRWQAKRIRAMLRDTHFRPRIGPEGPISGPPVTRHYRLISAD